MSTTDPKNRVAELIKQDAPLKWVFTGDSITHGALHTFGYRDYTEHFSERIRWELGRRRDCVIKTGISGQCIGDIAEDLEWRVLQFGPQVVSLHLGMNDCVNGAAGVEHFVEVYTDVLSRIGTGGSAVTILHTPNLTFETAERKRCDLALYAEAVRNIASAHGAILVDHAEEWMEVEKRKFLRFHLSDDIHPNEYGHRAMARTLFRALDIYDERSLTCRLLVP